MIFLVWFFFRMKRNQISYSVASHFKPSFYPPSDTLLEREVVEILLSSGGWRSSICLHYRSKQATCTYLDPITSLMPTTRVVFNHPEGLCEWRFFFINPPSGKSLASWLWARKWPNSSLPGRELMTPGQLRPSLLLLIFLSWIPELCFRTNQESSCLLLGEPEDLLQDMPRELMYASGQPWRANVCFVTSLES